MGIGGIGMSGIAKILQEKEFHVSGCDPFIDGPLTKTLTTLGCTLHKGHDPAHIDKVDVLVVSSAIDAKNPELREAKEKGIIIKHRGEILGWLTKEAFTIAIAGSHGKTSTTALVAHLMRHANLKPTIICGGILKNINSNAELGTSKYLVAEADESDRSLLYLYPAIAILTNVNTEHIVMTYKDLQDIKDTFSAFLARLPKKGLAIINGDDKYTQDLLPLRGITSLSFGFYPGADVRAYKEKLKADHATFTVTAPRFNNQSEEMRINIPGRHNIYNALAAITVCLERGVELSTIQQGLATFTGVERRFEYRGTFNKAEIFDDYGHHPTEIAATLSAARGRAKKRLIVAFAPQRYSRTKQLWDEFVELFAASNIDTLLLADIYAAGETPVPGITGENLVKAIKEKNPNLNVVYVGKKDKILSNLKSMLATDDLLLTLGAGKLNEVATALITENINE